MAIQLNKRGLGKTEISVTELGLGGAPLGNMLDPEGAIATIRAAADGGISYIDTAPFYGFGVSETRIGEGIAALPRAGLTISTKVGYKLVPIDPAEQKAPQMRTEYDWSADAVLRSVAGSLERLKASTIDMIAIHDPDESFFLKPGDDPYAHSHFKEAMDGAYKVLADLRSQGVIKAVGVGMNQWQMLCDFAEAGDFDYFLVAGRYTLLDQDSLARLLPLCEKRSISIIIGGPYNSGILATGAVPGATYDYSPAAPDLLRRVQKIEAVCGRHGVSLQAAALQFPLYHPLVASVIPGARSIAEVEANLAFLQQPIPVDFWAELKAERLIDPAAPTS